MDQSEAAEVERVERAYGKVFDDISEDIRRRAAGELIRVLREEDGTRVSTYQSAFFRRADLKYVASNQAAMVGLHLLSLAPSTHNANTFRHVDGIAQDLEPSEADTWRDPFIRTVIVTGTSEPVN